LCEQARKEELWEVAKAEGARGDTKSDTHYIKNVAGGLAKGSQRAWFKRYQSKVPLHDSDSSLDRHSITL
jgi:hypothetical protein